jgi:glycosyltransferase involved in cell wall biosynthesis
MKKSPRIQFIATDFGSFIEYDYEILKKYYKVHRVDTWLWKGRIKKARYFFSTILHISDLFLGLVTSDIIFIWFANVEVDLILKIARIFHKKTVVVIGGGEVAREPEISYGKLLDQKNREKIEYILKNADRIIAVSDFSKTEILRIDPSVSVEMIYNCVDTNVFKPAGDKEQFVLSVAYVKSHNQILLKGLDTLCKSAALLPNVRFRIIGIDGEAQDQLIKMAPENVEFHPPVGKDQIIKYCQSAHVYCQLSYRESFGMALVEAMACGCIPVVTDRGALPEIIEGTGYIVPYSDQGKTVSSIKMALQSQDNSAVRDIVIKKFSREIKEKKLLALINNID